MQNFKLFILLVVICVPLFIFVLFFQLQKTYVFNPLSPIPQSIDNAFASNSELHYWQPNISVVYGNTGDLTLSAEAAISYDLTTDKLLYSKNIKKHMPIASLTKIMTAIVALETMPLSQHITVSKSPSTIGDNSMGLSDGEVLSLNDLLYGLILPSGNDAAEAIAQASSYGRGNFVYLMNKKAEDLGLSDTHFTNPSGLEGDGDQYSTAYDLLVMSRYGMQNSSFARIVSTVSYTIPQAPLHKEYDLVNDTNLLTSYPGVKGIKIGFTDEAGLCLVTYLDYQGHTIIAVLLHSDDRRGEMKELLDYSLGLEGIPPPQHS